MNAETIDTETIHTETLDTALSELLQLRWSWEYEERSAAAAKQIEEQAGRLAAEAPALYGDAARSLAAGLENAPPLDPPARAVAPPDPGAATAPPSSPVETLLAGLGADPDNIEEADLEPLLASAPVSALAAPMVESRLPVRNATASMPPHIQLLAQHGGLVHGAIVTIGGSRLVCRAFSWFRHTSDRKMFGPGRTERVHTVAGVCEQFSPSGAVVARFSTAERLADVYRTTSQPLLDGAWRVTGALGTGEGFYETELTAAHAMPLLRELTKRGSLLMPDSGIPDPHLYGSDPFFAVSPGPNAAPENARFDQQPFGSDGWVIKTPYLAVYAPDPRALFPDPSEPYVPVIVAMLSVYRSGEWITRGKGSNSVSNTRFERKAQWRVRSFRLPLAG